MANVFSAFEVKIKFSLTVTQQDIDDIMCTALEGGIAYWCCMAKVIGKRLSECDSEQISRGGELKLYDVEGDGVWILTRDKLLNGIKLWAERGGNQCSAIQGNGTLDTGEIDAEVADMIVRYALFRGVVFGE